MSKLLVDTNVLVYGIDQDSQFYSKARDVIENTKNQLFTTSKNLSEFLAVVTRSSGYDLEPDLALEILEEIIAGVTILYPNHESLAIFLELIGRYSPTGLRVHDFEMISIGLAHEVDEFATFNIRDFEPIKEVSLLKL
ncbi:Predicted nucleic acid-binding protein, contains PIN domain [Fodinibius roseus]|uniref:Predicted nucleic acid-binding protein, contains PIN domain n=1 Tax=Fodinibius roseus TaxID=1194090 RepID=A0A1M5JVJ7_9BACT|nr:PIN domain-containing protein [Fodinibius roseus]SHG44566.1 Predicted nucleic acid-binding protein, contains PIN domain [Fodinibius roseus]